MGPVGEEIAGIALDLTRGRRHQSLYGALAMHKLVGLLRMRRHSLGNAGGVKGRVRRDDGRSVGSLGVHGGLEVAAQVIGLGGGRGIIDRIAVGAVEAERRSIALITAAAVGAGA